VAKRGSGLFGWLLRVLTLLILDRYDRPADLLFPALCVVALVLIGIGIAITLYVL
jgi:hypothetical protein